jgi:hypothetical protein
MPTPIVPEHHVARHCRNRHIIKDEDGRAISVFDDAFALRQQETYLSAGWMEFFTGDRSTQLSQLRDTMAAAREIKPKDGLAIMNVGRIIDAGQSRSLRIRVLHEPNAQNPAYAAIRGIPRDHQEILEALATDTVVDVVLSEQIP